MEKNSANSNSKKIDMRMIICISIIILILLASICFIFYSRKKETSPGIANIYQNGILIDTIVLSNSEDKIIYLTNDSGHSNTLCIKDHDLCIIEADCPDKLCVKQGYLGGSLVPIVCLPNRLIITHSNYPGNVKEDVDAITY